jgi:hypothetical protein
MVDSSGHNHTGAFKGTVAHGRAGALIGDSDTATGFDGLSTAASAPLNLSSTSRATLEFWLKWTAYADDDRLALELGAPYQSTAGVLVDPNSGSFPGRFELSLGNGSGGVASTVTIARPSAAAWHHYALVLDHAAGTITPYVDGAAVASTVVITTPQGASFATTTLNLMSRGGTKLFGAGMLDELAVYPTALSASQVAKHYTASGRALSSTTTSSSPTPSPTLATPSATPSPTPLAASTPAPSTGSYYGNVLWSADFESGDFSQWPNVHQGGSWGNSTASIVSAPARQGTYAAKLEVDPGSQNPQRVELSQGNFDQADAREGKEWFYSFSHYVPSVPNQGGSWTGWTNVMQWMDSLALTSPPLAVAMHVYTYDPSEVPQYTLGVGQVANGTYHEYSLGQVNWDAWQDFTLQVHWSANPSLGWAQVWRNGAVVLPKTYGPNIGPGGQNYMEAQLYRPQRTTTNIVYFDRVMRHDAYVP